MRRMLTGDKVDKDTRAPDIPSCIPCKRGEAVFRWTQMGQSVYICIYLQDIIKNYTLAQVDGQWSSVTAALSYLLQD